jgi:siroheme synthase (precorrin-2 oxidase/ferrochelatase)
MLSKDVSKVFAGGIFHVVEPIRETRYKFHENVKIVGFDTEFDSKNLQLLSYQVWCDSFSEFKPCSDLRLREFVRRLRKRLKMRSRDWLILVSHYAFAELSHCKDFAHFQIQRLGSGWQIRDYYERFILVDLFSFFQTSLEKLAQDFGYKKLEYDRTSIGKRDLKRAEFIEYAVNDARIVYKIFNEFRKRVWKEFEVDIVNVRTAPSLAAIIFKKMFLDMPVKIQTRAIRQQALLSYWGARAEAFKVGTFDGKFYEYDVVSMYPTSVYPVMPCSDKHFVQIGKNDIFDNSIFDGFVRVEFQFPSNEKYPCLPVVSDKMYYVLRGITDCSLSEVRLAVEKGAKIKYMRGWGFVNGTTSVRRYMDYFLKKKSEAQKDGNTTMREIYKLLLNALTGKFNQRRDVLSETVYHQYLRRVGLPNWVAGVNPKFKSRLSFGSIYVPEWATIILGRSRAEISSVVDDSVYLVSTDSFISDKDYGKEFTKRTFKKFHDPIIYKYEQKNLGDHLTVFRSKLYFLRCGDKYVKEATHAVPRDAFRKMTPNQLEELIGSSIVIETVSAPKFRTAGRRGLSVEKVLRQKRRINLDYDNKRMRVEGGCETLPYCCVDDISDVKDEQEIPDQIGYVRHRDGKFYDAFTGEELSAYLQRKYKKIFFRSSAKTVKKTRKSNRKLLTKRRTQKGNKT